MLSNMKLIILGLFRMGKIKTVLFFLNVCLALFAVQIDAQVTIGSTQKPNKGALLDLKQETVTTKGLGMPRVQLKEANKLTIGDKVIADEDNAWAQHTGLIVYNINKCFEKGGNGLYVWDGSLWQKLSGSNMYSDALYLPNSYNVTPGTTKVDIPVEKAFRIWEYYGSTEGNNRLPSELVEGELTPVLYWQDAPIILSAASLSISGNNRSDIISVKLAGGTVEGNAVIALKDGSGTIRWSWHIWVTDDPTEANLNGGGLTWMDRNLGAVSATAGDVGTIGLTYQWGRKDPFPMAQAWDNAVPKFETEHGELVTAVDVSLTNENTSQVNFKSSISSPISFIRYNSTSDWYISSGSTEDPWNERWDRTEDGCFRKSPFDPCPEGWRVPAYKYDEDGIGVDNTNPWQSLKGTSGELLTKRAQTWEDFGVYPFSGYRLSSTGAISSTTTYGYLWTATPYPSTINGNRSHTFYYGSSLAQTTSTMGRGFGFSVRCVKE